MKNNGLLKKDDLGAERKKTEVQTAGYGIDMGVSAFLR